MTLRSLHLGTFDQAGGAARTMGNLCAGLRKHGHTARILARDRTSSDPEIAQAIAAGKDILRRTNEASLIQRKLVNPARSPVSNTWFSLPEPGWDISGHPEVQQAEILHLHWVAGFLSPASIGILQQTGKPVVWTLHDQRPFTGGCHFTAGCRRYERDCDPCPQLEGDMMFGITRSALQEALRQMAPEKLTIVCPSEWLATCASESALFSRSRIEVIPGAVNLENFAPQPSGVRSQFGWAEDTIVLLGGAVATQEIRKGFGLLFDALRICANNDDFAREAKSGRIRLVMFGEGEKPANLPLKVEFLGKVASQKEMAKLYSASSVLIVPSIEDNLPNTMLESLCCGTPVIGFDIGGMPDGVTSGEDGWLANEISAVSLARELLAFCLDSSRRTFDKAAISRKARERFSMEQQTSRHIELYSELLSRKAAQGGSSLARPISLAAPSEAYQQEFATLLRDAKKAQWKNRWARFKTAAGLSRKKPGKHNSCCQ